jgi:hypothetical protein
LRLDYLGIAPPNLEESETVALMTAWMKDHAAKDSGFVLGWELQSQLSRVVLVSMMAFVSVWLGALLILAWSLVAAHVYDYYIRRGRPDLLQDHAVGKGPLARGLTIYSLVWAIKLVFAGPVHIVLAKGTRFTLTRVSGQPYYQVVRGLALLVSSFVGGVTVCHHLLRTAGFSRTQVYWGTMAGRLSNLGYQVLYSAFLIHLIGLALAWANGVRFLAS